MFKKIFQVIIFNLLLPCALIAMNYGDEGYSDEDMGFTVGSYYGNLTENAFAPLVPEETLIRRKSLQSAIANIRSILRIRDFDSSILSGTTSSTSQLNFEGLDISFCTKIVDFYSEDESERLSKFRTDIRGHLLQALKDAVEFSYDFPQTLKVLSDPSVIESPLLNAAIQDIFTNEPIVLKNLESILQHLDNAEDLSKEDKDSLFPLRKIAGYFYDRKALEYIIKEISLFFSPHKKESLNFGDPMVRFALLKILQWSGEFLKLLLPSTLNLSTALPEETLLYELRDQHLSHITRRKLELILNPPSKSSVLFEELYDDIHYLETVFESMYNSFPVDTSFSSPLEHWTHMKLLPETRKENPSTYEWRGLRGLRDLFTYSKKSASSAEVSYDNEAKVLIPLPYSEAEVQDIRKFSRETKDIWDLLSDDQIKDVDTLHKTLESSLKREIVKQICEEFWNDKNKQGDIFKEQRRLSQQVKEVKNQYLKKLDEAHVPSGDRKNISIALDKPSEKALKKAQEVIKRLELNGSQFDSILKAISNLSEQIRSENKRVEQQREELNQKLEVLKKETRAKILGKTSEEVQQTIEKNRILDETQQKQRKLAANLADPRIVRPSHGHRNFTDTYRDFHAILKAQGVQVEESPYSWYGSVQSPIEQLFYKAHCIPIVSQSDKLKHRYGKIRELIRIINFIRSLTRVTADLRLEAEKECFKSFITGKSGLMSELLHSLKKTMQPHQIEQAVNKDNLEKLWLRQGEFRNLESQVIPSLSSSGVKTLEKRAAETMDHFLAELKKSKLLKEQSFGQFERELGDRSRSDKKRQVLVFVKKEQVKSNPRPHEPLMLSQEVEQDVKENKMNYLAYEFLVAAFYELFKEVNDYPELSVLRTSDKIRNFFFHTDPFKSEPLIVGGLLKDANVRIENPFGQLAKEVTILTVNTKFLLEEFLLDIIKYDSYPETKEPENKPDSSAIPPQPRKFELDIQGKRFSLSEVDIPGNGDCGYLAMGITRSKATKLLLANANKPEIRALVADEIYDMFATLPDEMKCNPLYENLCAEQEVLDIGLQKLLSEMNDLIQRPEKDRWSEDAIFAHFSIKDSEKQLDMKQQEALQQLIVLRERYRKLETSKKEYCNAEVTFKEYVTFYMQPQVLEYLIKYGESNWLNFSSIINRTSSADAIAYLTGNNLAIVNEESVIEHEHYMPTIPIENLFVLLHIGNWHFNRLA